MATDGNHVLTNCTFSDNSADNYGGGMIISRGDSQTLTNCRFTNNSASKGGGVLTYDGYPILILTNCIFNANSALTDGGGFGCGHSEPTLINCTFIGNSAGGDGGGICSFAYGSILTVTNCILWGNTANEGPQIALESFEGSTPIDYSCVQGGEFDIYTEDHSDLDWDASNIGEDLINDNPLFADADNDDYHLLSQAGRWDPVSEGWVVDAVTSPCIDAGDPASDWTAELWPHGKLINMGAFGGTAQASMSTSSAGNIADMDNNGSVDSIDLTILADKWLYQQVLLSEDLDRDGLVNSKDFAIFANNWLWEE
jgi:predicted outer membrane repeat protein